LLTKRIVSIEKLYLGSILENTTGYHTLRSFEHAVRARKLQCLNWTLLSQWFLTTEGKKLLVL